MGAIREVVGLETGIAIGREVYFDAVLRPATLTDTYRATEAVPVPENLDSAAARIAYQVQVDDAVVLCQIEALGELEDDLPGPAELAPLLDPDDMTLLRAAAVRVKKKLQQSRRGLPIIDVPSACSSEADSPSPTSAPPTK